MKVLLAKKIALSGAVLLASVIPSASAGAMASGTNISSSNNLNTSVNANKTNANTSSNVTYFNKSVHYVAFSYVKYDASVTAFTANRQASFNNASLNAQLSKSSNTNFSMPSYFNGY